MILLYPASASVDDNSWCNTFFAQLPFEIMQCRFSFMGFFSSPLLKDYLNQNLSFALFHRQIPHFVKQDQYRSVGRRPD